MTETFRLDLSGDGSGSSLLRAVAVLSSIPGWRLDARGVEGVGARAGNSGAGRVHRLAKAIQSLPPDASKDLLDAIAEITRPMKRLELEHALLQTDLNYRERRAVVYALKNFDLVAVVRK